MYEPPDGYATLFTSRHRRECMESRLVLEAVEIPAEIVHRDGLWYLIVRCEDATVGGRELEEYRSENQETAVESKPTFRAYDGAAFGFYVYATVIIVMALLSWADAYRWDWIDAGRMQAGRVIAGESWRVVTALTLHADLGHLAGNLVFGAVFGLLAGRILGGGVGWLVILSAGAIGNFANARLHEESHSSIGASTAVFAALGVIVSHELRDRFGGPTRQRVAESWQRKLKRWSPLIAGVVLLGFTGVGGERTDVTAHVAGFVAGLALGWAASAAPMKWLASSVVQKVAGAAAVLVVVVAWIIGLANAG